MDGFYDLLNKDGEVLFGIIVLSDKAWIDGKWLPISLFRVVREI